MLSKLPAGANYTAHSLQLHCDTTPLPTHSIHTHIAHDNMSQQSDSKVSCPLCGKRMGEGNVSRHVREQHTQAASELRRFQCATCGFTTSRPLDAHKHSLTHAGHYMRDRHDDRTRSCPSPPTSFQPMQVYPSLVGQTTANTAAHLNTQHMLHTTLVLQHLHYTPRASKQLDSLGQVQQGVCSPALCVVCVVWCMCCRFTSPTLHSRCSRCSVHVVPYRSDGHPSNCCSSPHSVHAEVLSPTCQSATSAAHRLSPSVSVAHSTPTCTRGDARTHPAAAASTHT
jgi:hypothetical protein